MTGSWKLVPVEAPELMRRLCGLEFRVEDGHGAWRSNWPSVLAAAPTPPDEVLEMMARAHDREDSAKRGEPSPWDFATDAPDFEEFRAERIEAMRAALSAVGEKTGE